MAEFVKKLKQRYAYSTILLRQMVITDFKLRYQGSVLGYVWSLLRPLFLFVILYFVFAEFLNIGKDIPHYPVYLLVGIVLWNFFAEITSNGVSAVVSQGDLIRKLNFPKYVIILAAAVSALINLALNLIIIAIFLAFNHVDIQFAAIFAPLYIFEIFVFAIALAFILSTLFVRLRDINYIWEVIMQAAFYATPIIYPLTKVSERSPELAKLLLINPVAQAIQDVRYGLVTNQTQTIWSVLHSPVIKALPFIIVLAAFVFAVLFFKKRSPYFAEDV
ncbi:MAG TPA: ABC transporter permease [Candidatus Saccharimonadales bacterium]|nr:ABC transporter permease [Candidatus Saccharimonadales bacterium]